MHQIAPFLKKFLRGGGMPPNPLSKAHGFAMRSMSLRDMQISKSEKNIFGPPCQILATPLTCTYCLLSITMQKVKSKIELQKC